MRKSVLAFISFLCFATLYSKTPQSEILFDKTVHNFGKFSEANPVVSCKFIFKNVGDAPLIINQAIASCGCTVPSFTEKPVMPGETGEITVTYNGKGRYIGPFQKIITVTSNAETKHVRLYIKGEMEKAKKEQEDK